MSLDTNRERDGGTAREQGTDGSGDETDPDALRARVAKLAEENERLRAEYRRARQAKYRRTALGLAVVGLAALGGAAAFPAVRDVLVVLGAIGVFGGVLTFYLTPERVVTASVADRVSRAASENGTALVDELGLRDERVYVPGDGECKLFVPQHADYRVPTDPSSLFVTGDDRTRGVALVPTGAGLFEDLRDALAGDLATDPAPLAGQAADALVEQFELADGAEIDVEAGGDRVTVALDGPALGDPSRFDHPAASLLAVTVAAGLDRPVRLTVAEGSRSDALVTLVPIEPDDGAA